MEGWEVLVAAGIPEGTVKTRLNNRSNLALTITILLICLHSRLPGGLLPVSFPWPRFDVLRVLIVTPLPAFRLYCRALPTAPPWSAGATSIYDAVLVSAEPS